MITVAGPVCDCRGYLLDFLVVIGGEPLGDLAHHPTDDQPGEDCEPDAQGVGDRIPEDPVGEAECTDGGRDQGEVGATAQGAAGIVAPNPHQE